MTEQINETVTRVAVFGGASGGAPSREGLRQFNKEWEAKGKDWDRMDVDSIDALDAMWLAADIGRVLAENDWQLVTGGYDMGTMGMVSRSAAIFGEKRRSGKKPVGIPLTEYFPRDPHTTGDLLSAKDLPDRLSKLTNAEAFIVLRGAHGTLNELTTVMEEEDLRDDATKEGNKTFKPRPVIVADPSGRMEGLLSYIFGVYTPSFYKRVDENIIDRVYILGKECFLIERKHPLSATVKLTQQGTNEILSILKGVRSSSRTIRDIIK
ncbi:hypothetical protein A2Z22_01190 [Candidatus Woesebacteria bacterium RBG_16_34_12]|uniref:Uncharacterized protein n=1 Tax=Candidatus Woesebacteria bacterium RBG_16_34_12 TaxID=1802480 RepID=A0A1F7X8L7_9BACT|nr:MAG: hypothetical protein A2Z22_01190 [Candidatus Woesebacteria bacterium RBG_16_34_12]